MSESVRDLAGMTCIVTDDDGPVMDFKDGGRWLVESALNEGARVLVVPATRIDPAFFELRTGIAGEALQKFVNYKLKFAVVGDVSAHVDASTSLRDFVVECNRGHDVFFVAHIEELTARLQGIAAA